MHPAIIYLPLLNVIPSTLIVESSFPSASKLSYESEIPFTICPFQLSNLNSAGFGSSGPSCLFLLQAQARHTANAKRNTKNLFMAVFSVIKMETAGAVRPPRSKTCRITLRPLQSKDSWRYRCRRRPLHWRYGKCSWGHCPCCLSRSVSAEESCNPGPARNWQQPYAVEP